MKVDFERGDRCLIGEVAIMMFFVLKWQSLFDSCGVAIVILGVDGAIAV
jgi:hypothetical protein